MEESSVATGYENVFFKNETVVVDLGKNIAVLDFDEPVKNCLIFFKNICVILKTEPQIQCP